MTKETEHHPNQGTTRSEQRNWFSCPIINRISPINNPSDNRERSGMRGCRHSVVRRATRPCCSRSLLQGKAGAFIPHPEGRRGRPGAKAGGAGIRRRVEGVAVGGLLVAGSSADHGGQRSRISGSGRAGGDERCYMPICLVSCLLRMLLTEVAPCQARRAV
jgi:hypothetical protein